MEHLAILEKICDNISDSLERDTVIYIFANAIYNTWSTSDNKLEENLAKGLVSKWESELTEQMQNSYRETKYQENRLENDDYYKKWIESKYKDYSNNKGIQLALSNIWEKSYGFRHWADN